MRFEVLILGNSSATPAYGRHPTSQILRTNNQQFLIDCGEGTQMQMQRYRVKFKNLHNIFISHLHGDHFYGLIGLITSFNLNNRVSPLHIYCPKGLDKILATQLKHGKVHLAFELIYHFTKDVIEEIYKDDELIVYSFPLTHRIQTTGFFFTQCQKKLNIRPEKINELQLSYLEIKEIKDGRDLVRDNIVISNAELTKLPSPPKSYAFVSDTLYSESFSDLIQGVTLLYHESTFTQELENRAKETFHCTAADAARVANNVRAERLIIGHFSARYEDVSIFLSEAKSIFQKTEIAEEGSLFEI